METKRTSELRQRRNSLKARLTAALSMAIISAIMLTGTTYAWFVLSTAPEVKGMSTTVGSNGSLEIALLDDSTDTNAITTGVGDSVATTNDATVSNKTWGNIVDLSDGSYGLSSLKLYPSALNLNAAKNGLTDLFHILKTPVYGVDGRVASLADNTEAGKFNNGSFSTSNTSLGVRGIGTVEKADPTAFALSVAKSNYNSFLNQARTAAKNALNNDNAKGMSTLLLSHAFESANTGFSLSVTNIEALRNTLLGLQEAVNHAETAIKWSIAAYSDSTGTVISDISTINLADYASDSRFSTQIGKLEALKAAIAAQLTAYGSITPSGEKGTYQWVDYSGVLKVIMDTDTLTIGGKTFAEIGAMSKDDATNWAIGMLQDTEIIVNEGLLSDTADFVDTYVSDPFDMQVTTQQSAKNATITANKTLSTDAYLVSLKAAVDALTPPQGTGSAQNIITTSYGYIVDLAFKANANTNLMLSPAELRVAGSTDDRLQGGGSTFTVTAGDIADLAPALRVVFVDTTNYSILGVAGLAEETATGVYALHMYDYTIDADGGVKLVAPKTDDTIVALTANQAKCISVLVYMDGNYTGYAMDEVTGSLNLQFASSTTLVPMEYKDYVPEQNP